MIFRLHPSIHFIIFQLTIVPDVASICMSIHAQLNERIRLLETGKNLQSGFPFSTVQTFV